MYYIPLDGDLRELAARVEDNGDVTGSHHLQNLQEVDPLLDAGVQRIQDGRQNMVDWLRGWQLNHTGK